MGCPEGVKFSLKRRNANPISPRIKKSPNIDYFFTHRQTRWAANREGDTSNPDTTRSANGAVHTDKGDGNDTRWGALDNPGNNAGPTARGTSWDRRLRLPTAQTKSESARYPVHCGPYYKASQTSNQSLDEH